MSESGGIDFEGVAPILRVRDLVASVGYYVDILGFKVSWSVPRIMASDSRGRAHIMLCEGDQGTWVWVGVSDAESLFEEYKASGAMIGLAPTNYQWACEIHVKDLDGHVLRFGSEPLGDRPFSKWVVWYRGEE